MELIGMYETQRNQLRKEILFLQEELQNVSKKELQLSGSPIRHISHNEQEHKQLLINHERLSQDHEQLSQEHRHLNSMLEKLQQEHQQLQIQQQQLLKELECRPRAEQWEEIQHKIDELKKVKRHKVIDIPVSALNGNDEAKELIAESCKIVEINDRKLFIIRYILILHFSLFTPIITEEDEHCNISCSKDGEIYHRCVRFL